MSTYFGGTHLGMVEREDATSFDRLVSSAFQQPVTLAISRKHFNSLAVRETDPKLTPEQRKAAKAERSDAKKTAYLVACTYGKNRAERRVVEGNPLLPCDLVFIDVDNPEQAASLLVDDLGPLSSLPFAYCAYHTASSTPDKPKVRIVVSADRIPASDLGRAVERLRDLLALPEVTRESFIANQPMFRPVWFSDDDTLAYHPVFASDLTLPPMTVADLAENAPIVAGRTVATVRQSDETGIENVKAPVMGLTPEQAAEALTFLDADDYHVWYRVAFALNHQFGDDGLELFTEWSKKSPKFVSEEDCEAKWKTTLRNPTRSPVTFRTVLKAAKDAGYDPTPVHENQLEAALLWVQKTPCEELLRCAATEILKFDMLAILERDSVEKAVVEKLKEYGHKVGLPAMRKAVREAKADKDRAEAEAAKKDTAKSRTEEIRKRAPWAEGMVYCAEGNKFIHRGSGNRFSPDELNNFFSAKLMEGAEGGRPAVLPQHFLLNDVKIFRVNATDYDPSNPTKNITGDKFGRVFLNTYLPTYPENEDELSGEAGEVLFNHIRRLVSDDREAEILTSFFACHVQEPGRKIRWSPAIQSVQGAGKSVFAKLMKAVCGDRNVSVLAGKDIAQGGKFSSWATGSQLAIVEELRLVGENRHHISDTMKPYITNDFVTVEFKGKDIVNMPNRQNYVMFTNYEDALPLTSGERRYFVLHSPIQTEADLPPKEHFDRLHGFIAAHPGAFRSFLLSWPYHPEFNPDGNAPFSRHKQSAILASASGLTRRVRQLLDDMPGPWLDEDEFVSAVQSEGVRGRGALVGVLRELGYREHPRCAGITLWSRRDARMDDLDATMRCAELREEKDAIC